MEPIDPPVPVPRGGWPRAMMHLWLPAATTQAEAFYEVALASRMFRRGVTAMLGPAACIAFPHQTVDEIARTFGRMQAGATAEALVPANGRWTPQRKAWVCDGLRAGFLTTDEACERFDLSLEEIHSWRDRDDSDGVRGLTLAALRKT